jgi:hypothetical protein
LPGFSNNYRLLFAADPPAPVIHWMAPAGQVSPNGGGIVNLEWNVTRGGQPVAPGLKIEFFYVPVAMQPVTATTMAGAMLVNGIAAESGAYAWDTRGLASGEYAVGARLDDHPNGNGHVVAWAAGTVLINDTTPPPIPVVHGTVAVDDALIVLWNRDDTTPDLAGYLVEYTIPDWDLTGDLPRVRRVLPHSKLAAPFYERVRLGGVLLSQYGVPITTTVCVRAYDASGNLSGCAALEVEMPAVPDPGVGVPLLVNAGYDGAALLVQWEPPRTLPAGYVLSVAPLPCGGPAATLAGPVDAGNTTEYRFTGLTEGAAYLISLQAYSAAGLLGGPDTRVALVSDPTDANADGLPDDWAARYGVSGADGDPDADGVINTDELALRTTPIHADSDGDAFYDGEELAWETDPCGPEQPPYHDSPRLAVVGNGTAGFTAAANFDPGETEAVQILNLGAGTMNWTAAPSDEWITLSQTGGNGNANLFIGVDPAGLAPGNYTGEVVISSMAAGGGAGGGVVETMTIGVQLAVLDAQQFTVRLPVILR